MRAHGAGGLISWHETRERSDYSMPQNHQRRKVGTARTPSTRDGAIAPSTADRLDPLETR